MKNIAIFAICVNLNELGAQSNFILTNSLFHIAINFEGMDELIEHLQINLGKNFGYEDDTVIEKLRDVMHELRSSRLDYAGNFV